MDWANLGPMQMVGCFEHDDEWLQNRRGFFDQLSDSIGSIAPARWSHYVSFRSWCDHKNLPAMLLEVRITRHEKFSATTWAVLPFRDSDT
jgi:hypothetical protein